MTKTMKAATEEIVSNLNAACANMREGAAELGAAARVLAAADKKLDRHLERIEFDQDEHTPIEEP